MVALSNDGQPEHCEALIIDASVRFAQLGSHSHTPNNQSIQGIEDYAQSMSFLMDWFPPFIVNQVLSSGLNSEYSDGEIYNILNLLKDFCLKLADFESGEIKSGESLKRIISGLGQGEKDQINSYINSFLTRKLFPTFIKRYLDTKLPYLDYAGVKYLEGVSVTETQTMEILVGLVSVTYPEYSQLVVADVLGSGQSCQKFVELLSGLECYGVDYHNYIIKELSEVLSNDQEADRFNSIVKYVVGFISLQDDFKPYDWLSINEVVDIIASRFGEQYRSLILTIFRLKLQGLYDFPVEDTDLYNAVKSIREELNLYSNGTPLKILNYDELTSNPTNVKLIVHRLMKLSITQKERAIIALGLSEAQFSELVELAFTY